jgi:large subunit ribosomal protein L23
VSDHYKIIIKPILTEKSTKLKEDNNLLCFMVARDANKIEIKKAVEALFKVKVDSVRTMNRRGKIKRVGRSEGKRPDWKKAYIKLKKGEKSVEYFEKI